ncbi:LexA family protein [Roseivivax isoporae]|uniref:LexA repressor DNA-binding domain-containing protein n=1 Tax=Roseivivax isoporae LMG 25204 TaxID=1449351 RepID=X7F102_9RHOB|nr:hypothetical protein [Roseivivax isoporae]ETX26552.1 hypothetical protein RISW2_22875 [Roseivivax isoporae LMG 25204]
MSGYGLTDRQRQALDFITGCLNDGHCPSFDEISVALGYASRSGVFRVVEQLVARGHLVRLKARSRALALPGDLTKRLPDTDRLTVLHIARRGLRHNPSAALLEIITALEVRP